MRPALAGVQRWVRVVRIKPQVVVRGVCCATYAETPHAFGLAVAIAHGLFIYMRKGVGLRIYSRHTIGVQHDHTRRLICKGFDR